MTARQYATPLAFKQALEQRLKTSSATGVDFGRRRQLLVFDRFLARLAQVAGDAVEDLAQRGEVDEEGDDLPSSRRVSPGVPAPPAGRCCGGLG